jgi:hypothetical protein
MPVRKNKVAIPPYWYLESALSSRNVTSQRKKKKTRPVRSTYRNTEEMSCPTPPERQGQDSNAREPLHAFSKKQCKD